MTTRADHADPRIARVFTRLGTRPAGRGANLTPPARVPSRARGRPVVDPGGRDDFRHQTGPNLSARSRLFDLSSPNVQTGPAGSGGEYRTLGDRPPARSVGAPSPLQRWPLSEERRLLILFGALWIVIGFIACVFGGER